MTNDIAGDWADTLAEKILGSHCACYAEAWPGHTCANERDAVAAEIRASITQHLSNAERDVLAERRRHADKGWTAEHDDSHEKGEIITADWGAIARLDAGDLREVDPQIYRDRLVDAASMVIAEIERLDRAVKRER